MSKFFSIPGMSHGQNDPDNAPQPIRERMARDPRFAEYYASKGQGPPVSGFTPGDEIMFKGDCARVIHEEYDSHSGRVETWVQASSESDSGTHRIDWAKTGDGQLTIAAERKTRD